eukprot:SAG31_NODE_1750_length_7353_cov_17.309209_3_plen_135_part_00
MRMLGRCRLPYLGCLAGRTGDVLCSMGHRSAGSYITVIIVSEIQVLVVARSPQGLRLHAFACLDYLRLHDADDILLIWLSGLRTARDQRDQLAKLHAMTVQPLLRERHPALRGFGEEAYSVESLIWYDHHHHPL